MTATVRLPGSLRQFADGQRVLPVPAGTVHGVVDALCRQYPAIGERVLDERGAVRRFVNIYVNGEDVRLLDCENTPVGDGDEVILAPAVAGG